MNIVQIYRQFSTEHHFLAHLEKIRWSNKPKCPYCKSTITTPMPKEKRHHCNNCNTTFSVTVGTIFHHTHLPLQKWFFAVLLILNAKKGISARQLARDLEVNKNTAWRISMKIREAMLNKDHRELLTSVLEFDETYIEEKLKKRKGGEGENEQKKRGRRTKKTPAGGKAS